MRVSQLQGQIVWSEPPTGKLPTTWSGSHNIKVVGLGKENGIDYIDLQVEGLCSVTMGTKSISEVRTFRGSVYLKLVSGTPVVELASDAYEDQTLVQTVDQAVELSGQQLIDQRYELPITVAPEITSINFRIQTDGSGVIRCGWPQLEQGTVATSPILTSGTAGSRALDSYRVTGPEFLRLFNKEQGAIVFELDEDLKFLDTSQGALFAVANTEYTNRMVVEFNTGIGVRLSRVFVGSSNEATNWLPFHTHLGFRWGDGLAYLWSGGLKSTSVPAEPDFLAALVTVYGPTMIGKFRRIRYFTTEKTDLQMQQMTTRLR